MFGDTKYYHVKQIKKDGKVIGNILLIGRTYGYIVQLHYFDIPGYKVNKQFKTLDNAEIEFNKLIAEE